MSRRGLLRAVGGLTLAAGTATTLAACASATSTTPLTGSSSPSSTPRPRKGGTLSAAFIDGSNASPSVLLATQTALSYTRARVIWDAIGELANGAPQWRLAQSVEPNADATKWTIRLRKGVEFHSGRPLRARDVVFSLQTYVKQQALQSQWLGDIDFRHVTTPDDYTVVLPLTASNGLMDLILAQSIFIFPEGTTNFAKADGSGPYVDAGYTPGQQATLTRNEHYWDASHGGPYLDRLELVNVTDANARMAGLKSGQFQYAASVPLTAARTERSDSSVRIIVPPRELWSDVVINANVSQPPFTDPRVVEALHWSVDRESLLKTVALGYGELGNDLFCQHDPYYDAGLPQYTYDPDKAKSLLAAAGASGLKLSVRTSNYQYGMLETAVAWAGQAKNAGLTVTLNNVAANDFYSDPKVFVTTPLQCYVSPTQPLPLADLTSYGSQAYGNASGLTKQVDPLLAKIRTAVGHADRLAALRTLQEYLHAHAGQVIPIRIPDLAASTTKVYGVKALGFGDYPSFRDAYLA